ncbi:MAG: hypothetical protein KGZ74_06510 [Chitinophagaceae bacterium]|nr:hypothetical protein [Chitinophagaceae bacterium]
MRKSVRILYKKGGANKSNPEPFVVLYDPPAWPDRITARRGYDSMKVIYSRKMTDDEWADYQKAWRCQAWKYKSIDGLLEDEIEALGQDHEEIKLLTQLKAEITKSNNSNENHKANIQRQAVDR